MKDQNVERNIINSEKILHFLCQENDTFPNNASLELCILKQAFCPDADDLAELIEQCFQKNGWPPAWRNGLYDIHHYHSTAHEALGVYSGWVEACFGGPGGIVQTAVVGDVIIIPAGVSHKNIKQSADFQVVGAYPDGQRWNMKYGRPGERPLVDKEIQQVPLPQADPVHGPDGTLMKIWVR
jgi:uncharacterized protein YjlB